MNNVKTKNRLGGDASERKDIIMMKMKNTSRKTIAALLAAASLAASLAGCGGTGQIEAASSTGQNSSVISEFDRDLYPDLYPPYPILENAQADAEADPSIHVDSMDTDDASAGKPDTVEEAGQKRDMASVDAIKEITVLIGSWSSENLDYRQYQIEIDGSENPYGLSWQYRPSEEYRKDSRLNKLYGDYVAACDWGLVFDVEFYKAAFPMLALQYDNNDKLLTEHFQTVGIREGRQGCEGFNLAAYMENCSGEIKEAFGDDYECYYFYYMLNHAAEKSIDTGNTGKSYPVWLSVEMSQYQRCEFNKVNEYREEVGAPPLTADPELMAFASWRAWYDTVNEMYAHDWMQEETETLDSYLGKMGLTYYGENTVKSYDAAPNQYVSMGQTAYKYRNSEAHYEAMVRSSNLYFGCSDIYYSGEHTMAAQFDLFARTATTSPYLADK